MKISQRKKHLYKFLAPWLVMESVLAAVMRVSESLDDTVKFVESSNARIFAMKQIELLLRPDISKR